MKGKSTKQYARKCKNAATRVLQYAIMWCSSCSWCVMSSLDEAREIAKDVPKGHFVVYVGEEWKRYVVEIALLKHPLFKILLDSAEEMFGFANGSKLYLPCKECDFVRTLQCIGSYRNGNNLGAAKLHPSLPPGLVACKMINPVTHSRCGRGDRTSRFAAPKGSSIEIIELLQL